VAIVAQSTAAARSLAQESADLQEMIGRFEIGRVAASEPPRSPARAPAGPRAALKVVADRDAPAACRRPEWAT
jgi:hypothetical protein